MRLFLLPVSTRRTLIYCERVQEAVKGTAQQQQQQQQQKKPPISERVINRASQLWAGWEKAEKGWQKQVTVYGNQIFKRIPFEEWGLKSIPPATKQRLQEIDQENVKFECLYPGAFLPGSKVSEVVKALATERQSLHSRRLWTSVALMPVSAPFALVPIIPNLPFFYLCFRAYSHYRALYGGRLLEHLMKKDLVSFTASPQMDRLYTSGLLHPSRGKVREAPATTEAETEQVVSGVQEQTKGGNDEVMLLQRWNGKLIAEDFHLPEMEIEIERAVEQVEKAIKAKEELVLEKKKLEQATGQKTGDIEK